MSDLLATITALFPQRLFGHLAARLGESENGVKQALQGSVPVVLSALIGALVAGKEPLAFDWAQEAARLPATNSESVTSLLVVFGSGRATNSPMARGANLLAALFKREKAALIEWVGQKAHIRPDAAEELLVLVAAMLPMAIGQHAQRRHLSGDAVATALIGMKWRVSRLLSPDLAKVISGVVSGPASRQPLRSGAYRLWLANMMVVGLQLRWYLVTATALMLASLGAGMVSLLQSSNGKQATVVQEAGAPVMKVVSNMSSGNAKPWHFDF